MNEIRSVAEEFISNLKEVESSVEKVGEDFIVAHKLGIRKSSEGLLFEALRSPEYFGECLDTEVAEKAIGILNRSRSGGESLYILEDGRIKTEYNGNDPKILERIYNAMGLYEVFYNVFLTEKHRQQGDQIGEVLASAINYVAVNAPTKD